MRKKESIIVAMRDKLNEWTGLGWYIQDENHLECNGPYAIAMGTEGNDNVDDYIITVVSHGETLTVKERSALRAIDVPIGIEYAKKRWEER